jgi:uncharacterized protein (DUF608 family)
MSTQTRTFTGPSLHEIALPIGGIGTGTISIGGRGHLADFEIYNRPWKGNDPRNTFFALYVKPRGKPAVAKLLEREYLPPFTDHNGGGFQNGHAAGAPRMREATFRGEYPFAWIELSDPDVPLKVELEAFNPFIPLNPDDSSLPCAILRWRFTNTGRQPVDASFLAAFANPVNPLRLGGDGWESSVAGFLPGGSRNEQRADGRLAGLWMTNPSIDPASEFYGTAALALLDDQPVVQTQWYQGGWWDGLQMLWNDFSADGAIAPAGEPFTAPSGRAAEGSLCAPFTLKPGQSRQFTVVFAWHFPNLRNYWNTREGLAEGESEASGIVHNAMLRTFAGARWQDAWDVAAYAAGNFERLERETRDWHDRLFASTLPAAVLDAASSQSSILRTTTVLRLADGRVHAFEGCHAGGGCCPMNCTHVWNYEQALAFLFPQLEQGMRLTDFTHNTDADGKMTFRTLLPLTSNRFWGFSAAADGQMGTILKAYREWQLSGDDDFLRAIWPGVKRALEYAWSPANPHAWDRDKDGVMEGRQHNTYDIEYFGPNTMMGTLYLGALLASARMARHLGEPDKAAEYEALADSGRARIEASLWNGEYYTQDIQVSNLLLVPLELQSPHDPYPKYQVGPGCLSDQMLGQWLSHVAGIGHVLDPKRARKAMQSVYRYNWRETMREVPNMQRVYALNDEPGLAIATWPKGGRPELPSVYGDEAWTGIEYQVAAGLIYEGLVEQGLSIVQGVRSRHDGVRRNPWNEFECGNHYARAMASWSLVPALSGFQYSAPEQRLGFAPRVNAERFRCVWTCGTAWGEFAQRVTSSGASVTLQVAAGQLTLKRLDLGGLKAGRAARSLPAGATLSRDKQGAHIAFDPPVTLSAGDELALRL